MTAKPDHEKFTRRVAMVADGLTARQIAKREGCGPSAISNWAKRHNIPITRSRLEHADWQALMDQGMTAREAAKATGHTAHAAYGFAKRTGQKWRPAIVNGKPTRTGRASSAKAIFAGLDQRIKEDVKILMSRGRYSLTRALAIATQPRVKFTAVRKEAAQ